MVGTLSALVRAMTAPRKIIPGRTWFVTRRTTRRHFLLRPDEDGTSQALYWYTTAVLAKKFGIVLHAVQVLSTHIHEVLTDVHGNLPRFVQERNRALANALKCYRKWPEEVFQRAPASYVELFGSRAIIDKIAYTIANCVTAALSETPAEWPGVRTTVGDFGRSVEVRRPNFYFKSTNPVWPERASIEIKVPHQLEESVGTTTALKLLSVAIDGAVGVAVSSVRAAGRIFATVSELTRVSFRKRSRSFEPFGARNPTFACSGDASAAKVARSERDAFLSAYQAALCALRRGASPPSFPEGSWRWCRELFGESTPPSRPPSSSPPPTNSLSVGSSLNREQFESGDLLFEFITSKERRLVAQLEV